MKYFKILTCFLFLFCSMNLIAQEKDNIETALIPFWKTKTMHNESVLMISRNGELPTAKLLFTPKKIISIRNAALDIEYKEGIDWEYNNGQLRLLKDSKAAYLTDKQLYPDSSKSAFPKKGGGLVLYGSGIFFHNHQLAVTYTHATNVWKGLVPSFQGENLPEVMYKLKMGSILNVLLFGDSIAAGCNASGDSKIPPYLPSWGNLVIDGLKRKYTGPIEFTNTAVGGRDSKWGLETVKESVVDHNPDLVILAFGMNDGSRLLDPKIFKANIEGMINKIRQNNPKVEFILVTTMLANPESTFVGTQTAFKKELDELIGPGIVMVDMTAVHTELLKYKSYQDMTGNDINHPNDFLIRWYAQQILGILIPRYAS